jgi:predicted transcriptional regulator
MSYNKKIDYLFVAFPSFLAECDELTPQDKAIFLYFVSSSHRNWYPSYRELSRKLSLGNSTIKKAIVKLQLLGFITARTSIRGDGTKNEINSYKVNLSNSEKWCPTLDLKEEIERCYELNGKQLECGRKPGHRVA